MKVLLVTPPMTQLNTPYPATAYLTGFLRSKGYGCAQADASLSLALRIFSKRGLMGVQKHLKAQKRLSPSSQFFLKNFDDYFRTIDLVVRFLQGKDDSAKSRLLSRKLLPEGPRFQAVEQNGGFEYLEWALGALGSSDAAKYLCTLYLEDLADVLREDVDPRFELARYGEKLAASAQTFDLLHAALQAKPTLIDRTLDEITETLMTRHQPDVVVLTVPFPGNVYGAFRIAKKIKTLNPPVKVALGGGYANTELRELNEPRVFDNIDYITLDDGERPLLCLLEHFEGNRPASQLLRTYFREDGKVKFVSDPKVHDIPFKSSATPTYNDLPLKDYLSLLEMVNPMHRLWSDGRWNKLTLAHGCYWKRCTFCDTSLDYIGRYEPASADLIVDRMEQMIDETGFRGFHFVDEAAPPAALRALSEKIIERGLEVSWWGNLRFDKAFTPELCALMARAGCIAVTGGLEVASDRLLKLMQKGLTVEQVAKVTKAFQNAGILVHAYLMYGFPTQTLQETVDSLEMVRQLFANGCLDSAYWHRFALTCHSPVYKNIEKYGLKVLEKPLRKGELRFARNDLPFEDPTGCDHDAVAPALKKALYNFMHGIGLDQDVRTWFKSANRAANNNVVDRRPSIR